jgi:hypothetical protein
MSVSKDQTAANANANANSAPADTELDASQLDQVAGGDPVVTQTHTNNQATTAQKQAEKADGYIRS